MKNRFHFCILLVVLILMTGCVPIRMVVELEHDGSGKATIYLPSTGLVNVNTVRDYYKNAGFEESNISVEQREDGNIESSVKWDKDFDFTGRDFPIIIKRTEIAGNNVRIDFKNENMDSVVYLKVKVPGRIVEAGGNKNQRRNSMIESDGEIDHANNTVVFSNKRGIDNAYIIYQKQWLNLSSKNIIILVVLLILCFIGTLCFVGIYI